MQSPWPLNTCPKCNRKTDRSFVGRAIGDEVNYWLCLECGTEFPAEQEPVQVQDHRPDETADI